MVMVSSKIETCQQGEKGIKEIKTGLTELSMAIKGAETESQIIVYRVIVAMLQLSRRPGTTEIYILCLFQLRGYTSTLYAACRCRDEKADSHAANCIFNHKIQLQIKMERILSDISFLALICITLYPQHFHPPTSTHT